MKDSSWRYYITAWKSNTVVILTTIDFFFFLNFYLQYSLHHICTIKCIDTTELQIKQLNIMLAYVNNIAINPYKSNLINSKIKNIMFVQPHDYDVNDNDCYVGAGAEFTQELIRRLSMKRWITTCWQLIKITIDVLLINNLPNLCRHVWINTMLWEMPTTNILFSTWNHIKMILLCLQNKKINRIFII